MDRPILHSLVDRLRADERLPAFAAALPARARVSESALPLLVAALYEQLERPLVRRCCPTTPTPAISPSRRRGSSARRASRCFPSRGVRWGSGLEPPPHLVGERARALDVLARGGLVCVSALALVEPMPPPAARPTPIAIARGDEPGIDVLAEELALAGYERVERVEERGQFAVRGGLVDVFPTTGREPLRIELFGDEIEGIRAFSPFTQRALREIDSAVDLSRRRAARRAGRADARRRRGRAAGRLARSDRPRAPARPRARLRLAAGRGARRAGPRRVSTRSSSRARASSTRSRTASRSRSTRSGRRSTARGLSEAENELNGLLSRGLDVVVAFAHRGEAERQRHLLRRVEPTMLGPGRRARRASSSRSRPRGAASSGATSASRCCPTRRSSAARRRGRPRRSAARSRASPTCAPATTSSTRTTASRS